MQAIFHLQQFFALALHHLGHRNAGRPRHDLGNFLDANLRAQQLILLRALIGGLGHLQLCFKLRQLAILQLGHFIQFAFALHANHLGLELVDLLLDVRATLRLRFLSLPDFFEIVIVTLQLGEFILDQLHALLRGLILFLAHRQTLDLQLDHAPTELVHDFRLGIHFHADTCGRLVDQVDGLVRQETIGDVAMAQLGRRDDGRVGNLDAVMQFVTLLQAAQDGNRALDRRLIDQHFLEASFERGVLLDILAILVERGRADAVQLAARQGGLQHIASVHRALGLACANHGVQFIDENDDTPFVQRDFLEHGFESLLKLAAILGTGNQCRHVEAQHLLALERLGHLAIDDALRQPFDNGRLADARLADQHRIILGAPLQNLDGATDFIIPPDHRIEFALTRTLGQIDAVFFQRFALTFGLLTIDAFAAAHRVHGGLQRLAREAVLLRQTARFAFVIAHSKQEHLAGDELIAALLRFLVGKVEQVGQIAANRHLAAVPFDRGQAINRLIERRLERLHIHPGLRQQRSRTAIVLLQQGEQQVLRLDHLVVVTDRQALCIGQSLLKFGGKFVEAHEGSPLNDQDAK